MRILHLADVHLDRPLGGLPRDAARRRRADLFQAFRRCLAVAEEREVDLVTIGGDLWDHERVKLDTPRSVAHELERFGRPVLMICGNHDPLLPGGPYTRIDWPENVRLVRSSALEPHAFDGVTIWAISWTGGRLTASFLDDFSVPDDGSTHLLLVHGTTGPLSYLVEDGDCTFESRRVRQCGFALCLAGHIHAASRDNDVVYPGSPEPLAWDEVHRHCVAIVEIEGGRVDLELVDVNEKRYEVRDVDCSGCESSAEVARQVETSAQDEDARNIFLKLRLVGEVGADCEIDPKALVEQHASRYAAFLVEDATDPLLDLETRAAKPGLDGLFVRKLKERIDGTADEEERRRLELALEAGIRAIEGHERVLHVD